MFESYELTPQEERERQKDLLERRRRGLEFKNRLETIEELGEEKKIESRVLKNWMKDMEDVFTRKGRGDWVLDDEEGWEKVVGMLTKMQLDLEEGQHIIETTGHTHSILPKYQAESIVRSIEGPYPRRSQSNSSVFVVGNRNHSSAFSASAAHEHVEKETHHDYPAIFAANTARAIHSIQTRRST